MSEQLFSRNEIPDEARKIVSCDKPKNVCLPLTTLPKNAYSMFLRYNTIQYNSIVNTMKYNAMQDNRMQHNIKQDNKMQDNTIQDNTMQGNPDGFEPSGKWKMI